jgi:hypothetical protein
MVSGKAMLKATAFKTFKDQQCRATFKTFKTFKDQQCRATQARTMRATTLKNFC